MTKPKANPLPRNKRGQGRKPGPNGKATERMVIKCSPYELDSYTDAAIAAGMSRSKWVKTVLNRS